MNTKNLRFISKKPEYCSESQLTEFARLVLSGGEVISEGLMARIQLSKFLIFLYDEDSLVGIAAIKNPAASYKTSVFNKAKPLVKAANYPFELGWVYIDPNYRGKGLAHDIVKAALTTIEGSLAYATSRSDNLPMHSVLNAHGFNQVGTEYDPINGSHKLLLFALDAN